MSSPPATLYQRLLGAEFDRLPPALRRFHAQTLPQRAVGRITIKNGSGVVQRRAARALGLPRPGENVPLELDVVPDGEREVWVRRFGRERVITTQWCEGGLLVERAGPMLLFFRVTADETGLTFTFQHNALARLRRTTRTALEVNARAVGDEVGWTINVGMQSPVMGSLVNYSGEIRPLWTAI